MTGAPAPLTIFNSLYDELSAQLKSGSSLSEFNERLYISKIDKLEKVDSGGAFELRGHLAAIQRDVPQIHANYKIALARSAYFTDSVCRYFTLLAYAGQSEDVLATFSQYREVLKSSADAYRHAHSVLHYSGWVETADAVQAELRKMGVATDLERGADSVSRYSETDVARSVGFGLRFLRERGVTALGARCYGTELADGRPGFLFELKITRPPTEVAELEWEMFGALGDAGLEASAEKGFMFGLCSENLPSASHA